MIIQVPFIKRQAENGKYNQPFTKFTAYYMPSSLQFLAQAHHGRIDHAMSFQVRTHYLTYPASSPLKYLSYRLTCFILFPTVTVCDGILYRY